MSKSGFVVSQYVTCPLCLRECLRVYATSTTVKGQLKNGQEVEFSVLVCWLCTIVKGPPLKGYACLVPLISTELPSFTAATGSNHKEKNL